MRAAFILAAALRHLGQTFVRAAFILDLTGRLHQLASTFLCTHVLRGNFLVALARVHTACLIQQIQALASLRK